jgi:phosphate transport system permease protein
MSSQGPETQPEGVAALPPSPGAGAAIRGGRGSTNVIKWIGRGGALLPTFALGFILVVLIAEAIPAFKYNGLGFFTKSVWNEGSQYGSVTTTNGIQHLQGAAYGAIPEIVGTLQTSFLALLIAVPVSIGAAMIIVERLPRRLATTIGMFLEVLAGIPSVVIGLWGVLTFGPFIASHITPVIARNAPDVPFFDWFRGDPGTGQGLLTSSLILAIMIIPIIAATSRDLIRGVPLLPREGAIALGMSDFECARKVTLPWVGGGIVGASVLGLARALGETIAVAMVSGFALGHIASNLYGVMTTIAATIVNYLDSAFLDPTGLALHTLAELALVLMVITLATNIGARILVRRVTGVALPVGRGL